MVKGTSHIIWGMVEDTHHVRGNTTATRRYLRGCYVELGYDLFYEDNSQS